MEILETKVLFPEGLNMVQHELVDLDLLPINEKWILDDVPAAVDVVVS